MESKKEQDLKQDSSAVEPELETPSNGGEVDLSATSEAAKPQIDSAERRLLYMAAEFENTKKRMLREQENSIRFANEKLVRDFLPIVNLFDRAMTAAAPLKTKDEKKTEIESFILGIEMTYRELALTLERFGVEWIGKKGEKFNPERHEALSQVESPDQLPDTIVQVLDRGCLLNGRLIQPAKVIIAKSKQES